MADDTNTAEREAVARAIWALMREHEDRCDEELEDLSRYHPVWEYADAARASLAASAGSEPVIGWHAFPHYLQHPDGRLLRTASDLLARHGYTGCAEPLRAMSDVLLSTNPSPPEGSVQAAPLMDDEIALIEKAVKRAGITSLLNHGAASCVFTEGCDGVSQEHLLAYTREIALHCAVALGSPPEGMAGWISVDERLPEPGQNVAFVVRANICGSFRLLNGRVLGGRFLPGEGFSMPGLCVDASHWMPLPAPPLPASEAKEL